MSPIEQTRPLSQAPANSGERGFSLLEMVFATTVLLVGIVGVAQLVPASLLLNQSNRTSSSGLVVVQHELEVIMNQPLSSLGYTDPQTNVFCALGDPTQPGQLLGSPLGVVNNHTVIDFSQNLVPGYNLTYSDPSDPSGATWDLRWAVITNTVNGETIPSSILSKRFIVGARQIGGQGFALPVTLDTMVSK